MPTETFLDVNKRLVMRYDHAGTFSLNKVRVQASNQAVFDLGKAISAVQSAQPSRITSVVTQQLMR